MVIVAVEQGPLQHDPNLLIEFAPILDQYLEALPITD
jgi:hypothetical protein